MTATLTRSPGSKLRPGPMRERTRVPSISSTATSWSCPKYTMSRTDALAGAVEPQTEPLRTHDHVHRARTPRLRKGEPAERGDRGVAVGMAGDDVGVTHERRDEPVLRMGVQVGGCIDLEHAAVAHDRDPVGDAQRLFLVVGDDDRGRRRVAKDLADLVTHLRVATTRRGWRTARRAARARGSGASARGERDALLLATGELVRESIRRARQPDEIEHLADASARAARSRTP